MKFFNKKDKAINVDYSKLSKALLKTGFKNKIKSAYRVLGIVNSVENLNKLKKAITENNLKQLKDEATYDVMLDDLDLYFITDLGDKNYFIILLDPYELLQSEQALEIIPANASDLGFQPEEIFPNYEVAKK